MKTTLAFDVYGTLIDTQGVLTQLQAWVCRSEASIFDPWDQAPTETIADLLRLTALFNRQQ